LTFGVEIFVVLCLLKWVRLIRNPVFYRESTSVEHYYPRKWIWLMRMCVPLGNGIVLQSEDSSRAYQRLGLRAKQIAIIQNPCVYAESARMEPFRLPDRMGPVRLLSVGRFARIKGHMRLIEAFECVQKVRPGSTLTLVGEGEELVALQEKVRVLKLDEAIRFVGYVSDIRQCLQAANIFVLPSFYEGLSNALIEALVCRCPVLAFGEGGSSEFMNNLGLGDFWCESDTFDQSLLDGIDRVCNSDAERWEHAWHAIVTQVSPKRVADQLWGFLGGALAQ
jgi:glycosyltransferase involved in cell wall biosynthesis